MIVLVRCIVIVGDHYRVDVCAPDPELLLPVKPLPEVVVVVFSVFVVRSMVDNTVDLR